jgi:hypothetical protein
MGKAPGSSHMSLRHDFWTRSFRTSRLERELQMVQLSAIRCSCIAILWVSLVSFAAISLCIASQRVFIVVDVYFVMYSVRKLLDTPSVCYKSLDSGTVSCCLQANCVSEQRNAADYDVRLFACSISITASVRTVRHWADWRSGKVCSVFGSTWFESLPKHRLSWAILLLFLVLWSQ